MKVKKQRKIIQRYLKGTASPEETEWVDVWYSAFENGNTADLPIPIQMAENSKQLLLDKIQRKNKLRTSPTLLKYAAVLAAAVFIFLATQLPGRLGWGENIVTISTKGKRDTSFQTPDHSTIWLKANSELSYNANSFGKKDRTVTLTKGEAYFEVRRNPSSRFEVIHNHAALHVLGTGFNVYTDQKKGNFNVMVSHGRVEILLAEKRVSYLKKGEAIDLNTTTGKYDTAHFNPKYAAAWRNEEIVLHQASFKELSDVFYSLYRLRLISPHSGAEKYTYTLSIKKNEDFRSTLDIITSIHQNKFKIQQDRITIY